MVKWLIPVAALLLMVAALFIKLGEEPSVEKVTVIPIDGSLPPTERLPQVAPAGRRRPSAANQASPEEPVEERNGETIDPRSEEFSNRVDVIIPAQFRALLASCDRSGADPDASIKLDYQLRIRDGVISASNVRVASSELDDQELERCMVHAVEHGRFPAEDMPDFEEDNQIFIRIRTLDKYRSADEEDRINKELQEQESGE